MISGDQHGLTSSGQGADNLPPSLEYLSQHAFDAFNEGSRKVRNVMVRPAMPILFFGDLERYLDSPLRIITVGLNPSFAEFPASDPWERFPAASGVIATQSAVEHARYVAALGDYFRQNPYRSWFNSYLPLLEGIDASFYDGCANTALHTDVCSPVATKPTWSRLDSLPRSCLIHAGRTLWHDLVRHLQPQVILVSVAREHLDAISFVPAGDWQVLFEVRRKHPYKVLYRSISLNQGNSALVVFGRAAQTPFGLVGASDKRSIGAGVKELLRA